MLNVTKIKPNIQYKPKEKEKNEPAINRTLEGVLINSHVKDAKFDPQNFDNICNSLMISQENLTQKVDLSKENKESFNAKKILTPLAIGTLAVFGATAGLSYILTKSSKTILKTKSFEQLPDLALNMNIKQEPEFAIYRMLRDPSFKNILGAAAVFLFSALTLTAKNFTDGVKEIWIKKQEADIERDLQENLIEVEAKSFSGKLNEVNRLLGSNAEYFKNVLNPKEAIFREHFSFKGDNKKQDADKKSSPLKLVLPVAGVLLGCLGFAKLTFLNIKKTAKLANEYANNYTQATIEAIEKILNSADKTKLDTLGELFSSIYAKSDSIKKTLQGKFSNDEISDLIKNVEKGSKSIFADAPTALGGIPKKIQYYCYLDENRGHLYNWVIHPENKFAKYIFLSFGLISSVGYLFKQGLDAVKSVAVTRENSKTELDLKKRLVDVEIANFVAKKNSAILPMRTNFEHQLQQNKPKEQIKELAENILFEIKNGPPYVYS